MTIVKKYEAEYASEVLSSIPTGYIDKTVCGCGLTTVALENKENVIIAVPSIELIRNKTVQYPNDRSDKLILGVYGSITIKDIKEYTQKASIIKIMVTYDSLHKVEYLLQATNCKLIIDESNKLISSSNLKSHSKQTGFVDAITLLFTIAEKYKHKVSFVSATPTPLEYLPEWISKLPQIKLEWSNTTKAKPILMKRTYPYKALLDEIVLPLVNNKQIVMGNGVFSKVIIFINSLETIAKTIKKAELNKKDVAIIAGDSVKNDLKIKGYNRLKDPTKLPKFTFITSSGFEGIDLVDSEAISVVVSNTGRNYQMIDVLTDLKQAISRQRNKLNPNYDKFIYIYNTSVFDTSKEELLTTLDAKYKSIVGIIDLWDMAKENNKVTEFQDAIKGNTEFNTYSNYYPESNTYKINTNLFNADKYFIVNIREQYRNGFDIKGVYGLDNLTVIEASISIKDISYVEMVKHNNSLEDLKEYRYKSDYYNLS